MVSNLHRNMDRRQKNLSLNGTFSLPFSLFFLFISSFLNSSLLIISVKHSYCFGEVSQRLRFCFISIQILMVRTIVNNNVRYKSSHFMRVRSEVTDNWDKVTSTETNHEVCLHWALSTNHASHSWHSYFCPRSLPRFSHEIVGKRVNTIYEKIQS